MYGEPRVLGFSILSSTPASLSAPSFKLVSCTNHPIQIGGALRAETVFMKRLIKPFINHSRGSQVPREFDWEQINKINWLTTGKYFRECMVHNTVCGPISETKQNAACQCHCVSITVARVRTKNMYTFSVHTTGTPWKIWEYVTID